MTEHLIVSRSHGELRVVVDEHPDRRGRPWRARLDPRPRRLGHCGAAFGDSPEAAVASMAAWVEQYDAWGLDDLPRTSVAPRPPGLRR